MNNRKGYAGYERDPAFGGAGRHLHHVRYRVYDADLGRWLQRDPQGYSDGMSLYAYVQAMAVIAADPWGLETCASGGCGIPKMPGTSGGGGLGPEQCAGGTCSNPKAPMPGGGGGRGPIICAGGDCEPPLPGQPGSGIPACWIDPGPLPERYWPPLPPPSPPPRKNRSDGSNTNEFHWNDCPGGPGCSKGYKKNPVVPPAIPNGCGRKTGITRIPGMLTRFNFAACCNNHDMCYASCGSNKISCDIWFLDCMLAYCDQRYPGKSGTLTLNRWRCRKAANNFATAVLNKGESAFCSAQAAHCQCQ